MPSPEGRTTLDLGGSCREALSHYLPMGMEQLRFHPQPSLSLSWDCGYICFWTVTISEFVPESGAAADAEPALCPVPPTFCLSRKSSARSHPELREKGHAFKHAN